MTLHIKIDKRLIRDLMKRSQSEDIKKVVLQNGTEMQQAAQQYAPVDTGHLKRSINLTSHSIDSGFRVEVAPTADYAPYLEYGTRFMGAKPFMRPAYNSQKQIFKKDLDRLMKS